MYAERLYKCNVGQSFYHPRSRKYVQVFHSYFKSRVGLFGINFWVKFCISKYWENCLINY